jgi:hypothetical protein
MKTVSLPGLFKNTVRVTVRGAPYADWLRQRITPRPEPLWTRAMNKDFIELKRLPTRKSIKKNGTKKKNHSTEAVFQRPDRDCASEPAYETVSRCVLAITRLRDLRNPRDDSSVRFAVRRSKYRWTFFLIENSIIR